MSDQNHKNADNLRKYRRLLLSSRFWWSFIIWKVKNIGVNILGPHTGSWCYLTSVEVSTSKIWVAPFICMDLQCTFKCRPTLLSLLFTFVRLCGANKITWNVCWTCQWILHFCMWQRKTNTWGLRKHNESGRMARVTTFEVVMTAKIHIMALWFTTPRTLVGVCCLYTGTYCVCLQDKNEPKWERTVYRRSERNGLWKQLVGTAGFRRATLVLL